MDTESENEHDTISWFRIGLIVAIGVTGLILFLQDSKIASYFFLGYAAFAKCIMLVFKTWRSSSEVDKVTNRQWKRSFRNIPRGILQFFLSFVAFVGVLAAGMIPVFFISNELYHEYKDIVTMYVYALVGISSFVFLWVGGFFRSIRRSFSDLNEIRDAAKRAKARRAKDNDTEK